MNESFEDEILRKKYLQPGEKSWEDLVERISGWVKDRRDGRLADGIKEIMLNKRWSPAGSMLAGIGATAKQSFSNCYVVPIQDDSLEGIFEFMEKAARTFSFRGGVGFDLSVLRPKGAPVSNSAKYSTGSVSFLPLISNMVQTIGQNGRRGACISTIEISHPDVEDFIKCKSHPDEVFGTDVFNATPKDVSGINLSVKLTDDFMQAVKEDKDWDLEFGGKVYKTVKARDLFHLIASEAWGSGDPGTAFWDNILRNGTTGFVKDGMPESLNPCGEQPLPAFSNCSLSSFNLLAYVDPTTHNLDIDQLNKDIPYVVEFMDLIVDFNNHPLKEQTDKDKQFRKMGIGITGLADTLALMGIIYGSDEAANVAREVMELITVEGFRTSVELAKWHGSAPILESDENLEKFMTQPFMQKLPVDLKEDIMEYGCRNTAITSIAPTGTLSIILGNLTSGCEPLFQKEYYRVSRITSKPTLIKHPPMKKYGIAPALYVTANEVSWEDRIKMQAALQEWTTDSISATINLPETATVGEIEKIYMTAWQAGLKGITVYRDNCKSVQVLSTTKKDKVKKEGLPDVISADRHIVRYHKSKTYLNVSKDDEGHPVEVFVSVPTSAGLDINGNFDSATYLTTLSAWSLSARLVSLCLRSGIPLKTILKQIKKSIFTISDLAAILYRTLSKYNGEKLEFGEKCPECGAELTMESGCATCKNCGYSRCG